MQKGLRCLKRGGFPATKEEQEETQTKYLICGNLFVLEAVPETSELVSINLTLPWFSSCSPLGGEKQCFF